MDQIKELIQKIKKFRDDRDWMQFHNPKDMAISIVLEASELLEHFQWKTSKEVEEHIQNNKREVASEIADVAIYLFELAENLGISLSDTIEEKLRHNEEKYPINKVKGNHTKYTDF